MNIQGFEIIEQIAEGSMGTVWKARQVSLDRVVAIKVLNPELVNDPAVVESFLSNAKTAAQLKHTSIIQVFDAVSQDDNIYFVMEYMDGQVLSAMLEKEKVLEPKTALKIGLAIAHALQDAWDNKQILHGDLTPDNIMLDKDGNIKVADLGLASMIDPTTLSARITDGSFDKTSNYMSPEQAQCQLEIDFRSNMYSLGAMLYDMMTGVVPFEDDDPITALQNHITGQIENPRDIEKAVTPSAANLISKLMAKNPDDRFKSWGDVIKEINRVRKGGVSIQKGAAKSAPSTIMPPANYVQTTQATHARRPQPVKNSVSMAIQLPAWIALIVWWILLSFIMYKVTGNKYLRIIAARQYENDQAQFAENERQAKLQKARRTAQIRKVVTEKKKAKAKKKEATLTVPDAIAYTPTVVQPLSQSDAAILQFKHSLLHDLLNRNFGAAHEKVKNELEYEHTMKFEDELYKLSGMLKELRGIDGVVLKGFKRKKGKKITIDHNGRRIDIMVLGVTEDSIKAEMVANINGKEMRKPVVFKASQLDSKEFIKWIDTSVSAFSKNTVRYVLYMNDKNYASAKKVASSCGALSDLFLDRLKQ